MLRIDETNKLQWLTQIILMEELKMRKSALYGINIEGVNPTSPCLRRWN